MEWYRIVGLIVIGLFVIIAVITDGFEWLSDDDDVHGGGIHP